MKKIIALVVAIVMMAAISVPAFADVTGTVQGGRGDDSNQTLVSYGVSQTYVVTVPSEIKIAATLDSELTDKFVGSASLTIDEGYKIAYGTSIKITMSSTRTAEAGDDAAKWYLNNENVAGNDLEYTVHIGSKTAEAWARNSTSAILEATAGVETPAKSVTIFCATAGNDLANNFSDTITFGVTVS